MNKTIGTIFLAAGTLISGTLALAQAPGAVPTPQAAPAKGKARKAAAAPKVQPIAIPAGAVKTKEGAYRFVDSRGRAWLYKETPFGISRVPETPAVAQAPTTVQTPFGASTAKPVAGAEVPASDPAERVTASVNGEVVQFTKPTPFGVTSWKKNRSELTPDEQKVLDRELAKRNQ